MEIPRILTETPNFDVPTGMKRLTETPNFDVPTGIVSDTDRDGVIDPWDCQPFNPDEDGLIGDIVRRVAGAVKPNYPRAAARRAAVRGHISRGIGSGVRTIRQIGGIVKPNYPRAARRRAAVGKRVRRTVKSLRIDTSPEAAAGRRAKIKTGLVKIGRRVAADETGAIAASARTLGGIAGMGAATRQHIERNTAIPAARQQVLAFTAPDIAFGIPAYLAGVGRQQIAPQTPSAPSTARSVARSGGQRYTGTPRMRRRGRAYGLPEPDLDASEW